MLKGSSHFDRPQPRKKSKHHGLSPKQNRPQRPLTAGDEPGLQMSPNLGDQVSHELRLHGANSQLCDSHRAGVTQFPRASVGGGRARKTQLQPHTNHPPTPCSSVSTEPNSGAGRCWPVLAAAGKGVHFFIPPPQQAPPPGQSVCGEDMATRPGNTGGCPPSSHMRSEFPPPGSSGSCAHGPEGTQFHFLLRQVTLRVWLQIGHRCSVL